MKAITIALAGLAAALAPAAASAQTRTVTTRTVMHSHTGPAYAHSRRSCTVSRHHGHRVRTCRTVRY